MSIKKYKTSKNKRLSKRLSKSKKTMKRKSMKRKSMKRKSMKRKSMKQKGGFDSDATILEPGFSVDPLGSIAGLTIPRQRASIFKSDSKSNYVSQAMTP